MTARSLPSHPLTDVPDVILELAGEAAAQAMRSERTQAAKAARKRRWRAARAAAAHALLYADHFQLISECFDKRPAREQRAIKRLVRQRLPKGLRGRNHPSAQLRRLRELVLVLTHDDLDDLLEQERVAKLRRELFAPFGAGSVLRAS